jgi:glucose-1-phosphate cytidylyltransferase
MEVHQSSAEPWRVTLVDTGADTQTGGRLKRVLPYIGDEEFCLTYGDGLADVDLTRLLEFHRTQGTLGTVTAVQPGGRFGALDVEGGRVAEFREKPAGDGGWINGGFFVLSPAIGDYIEGDQTVFEQEPLRRLAAEGRLSAYEHDGFWQPMDTMREKGQLEELWRAGRAPWKVWS